MCRFVVVVIFISCVSFGVLAEGDPPKPIEANVTCTKDDPELSIKRKEWQNCFSNTVKLHVDPSEPVTGDCRTATAFGEKLKTYIESVNTRCNKSITLNTDNLIKLIEFSLKNDSFKNFYHEIECVKKIESNISNGCVKANVGFFNVTEQKKHTSWATKARLIYNRASCSANTKVSNCVQALLHKNCNSYSEEYMANLFSYSQKLGKCAQFPNTTLNSGGNSAPAAPWLTLPVIITLSIGAVVVVVAIIIIVVSKCKNK